MLTTITVNGTEGLRFLTRLQESEHRRPVPPALAAMIEHFTANEELEHARLEVAAPLADEIAAFVADVSGGHGTPLLFSAQIGDLVVLVRDVLAEMTVHNKRESRTWQFVPAGTIARLVGRKGDLDKLLLLDTGGKFPEREHAFVSDRNTTRKPSRA